MSKESDSAQDHRENERTQREARIFMFVAGTMMVAAIVFGVLNSFHVIHM